tara:strand:- start:4167 stop:4358 length:192 start_codon:yes stop_codon:yes gene_type:complete
MECYKDCTKTGCNKECSMIKKLSTKVQRALVAAVSGIIIAADWIHTGVVRGLKATIAGIEWLF